jgi:hypothetical protein
MHPDDLALLNGFLIIAAIMAMYFSHTLATIILVVLLFL